MNIDEYDVEREASAPIDMLEHYFTALGWACDRTGEEEDYYEDGGSAYRFAKRLGPKT